MSSDRQTIEAGTQVHKSADSEVVVGCCARKCRLGDLSEGRL